MNYIITDGHNYFCGWDLFGEFKFVSEERLAYRMRRNVANTTLTKINSRIKGYYIETI